MSTYDALVEALRESYDRGRKDGLQIAINALRGLESDSRVAFCPAGVFARTVADVLQEEREKPVDFPSVNG